MKSLLLFLVLVACFSCSVKESFKSQIFANANTISDSISLDSLWQQLVFQKGGCLTGGQRAIDGKFDNPHCVLNSTRRADWTPFFNHPKAELTEFLLSKFADTTETRIHTCPLYNATNGEVAVYCLTKIYLVNWYDFEPFLSYQNREMTGSMDSEQSWLQAILQDPKQCEVLIAEWKKL